jgi:hypothetical protein
VSVPPSIHRELQRLEPGDPVIPIVELVFEVGDPAVTSAVIRKLLDEICAERSA